MSRSNASNTPTLLPTLQDSVLLLIGVQKEYATGHLKTKNNDATSAAISKLLARYRAADGDIIHIHSHPCPIHHEETVKHLLTPNTHLEEPIPGTEPLEDEVVLRKPMAGAFSRTELKKRIDATGKEKLVVVGYMVQSCVSTTVRQAYDLEYCIVVPRDCVGARDIPGATAEEVLAHELAVLDDLYCHVVDSKELKDE